TNVNLTLEYDPTLLSIRDVTRQPDTQTAGTLEWSLGTFAAMPIYDGVDVTAIVSPDAEIGASLPIRASLSSSPQDANPDNDSYEVVFEIEAPTPDLWVWTFGLFEELEQGFLWVAERNVPTTFTTYYFNWSLYDAHNVAIVDSLPAGVEYISAIPEPTSV